MIIVSDPIVKEGIKNYVLYKVSGKLLSEPIYRRFSDFFLLREKLVERWPGIYIPNIPQKQTFGNFEKSVIEMRTRVINDFCKKTAKFKFIIQSEEMKVFLMTNVEANKVLSSLQDLSYGEILIRFKRAFSEYDPDYDIQSGKTRLLRFHSFIKKALLKLENFHEVVNLTMKKKEQEIENYITLIHVFENYEKYTLMEYADNDENKLVFFNPKNTELCEKIMELKKNLKNPYNQLNIWLEDDILDFEAMVGTLESLFNLHETYEKFCQNLEKIENDLKSIESGFTTIKLILSLKSRETDLKELNENKNITIENKNNIEQIIKISSYNLEKYLEKFKIKKLKRYNKHLTMFSEEQKKNNDTLNDLWECVSKDKNLKPKEIIPNNI